MKHKLTSVWCLFHYSELYVLMYSSKAGVVKGYYSFFRSVYRFEHPISHFGQSIYLKFLFEHSFYHFGYSNYHFGHSFYRILPFEQTVYHIEQSIYHEGNSGGSSCSVRSRGNFYQVLGPPRKMPLAQGPLWWSKGPLSVGLKRGKCPLRPLVTTELL